MLSVHRRYAVDVTSLRAGNIVVSTTGCWRTRITAAVVLRPTAPGNIVEPSYISADVTAPGGDIASTVSVSEDGIDDFQWCYYLDPYGVHKVANTQVSWTETTAQGGFDFGEGLDSASTAFTVKGKGLAQFTATRSGNYVTINTLTRYFGEQPAAKYVPLRSAVTVQFLPAGRTGWVTKVRLAPNSVGRAAAKIYAPSVGYWRILAAPTAKSWDARSAVTRR